MTEASKAYKVVFMKARNSLVVRCREKRVNWKKTKTKPKKQTNKQKQKQRMMEIYFLKL